MKLHAAIARTLVDHGVDTVFGLVGDGNLYLAHSLVAEHGVRYVSAAHEAAAQLMADGYARASGRLGVALVTHGPGLMNTLTALTEAVRNRTPMLLVCGDTPATDREHRQEIDHRSIVAPTGAGFEQARSPQSTTADLALAIRRARLEHRPVVCNVPLEWQWHDVEHRTLPPPLNVQRRGQPDPEELDRALGVVASARRPIVLAGRGAIDDAARSALLDLAAVIGAPLGTTLMAKGLFAGEELDLGTFGTVSTPFAAHVIDRADCVVAFGAGLNKMTTGHGAYVTGKSVVQCDVEPAHLALTSPVDATVVGDAAIVAEAMAAAWRSAGIAPTDFRAEVAAMDPDDPVFRQPVDPPLRDGCVGIRAAVAALNGVLPERRSLVLDGGRFLCETSRNLSIDHPRHYMLAALGFGAIGNSVAAGVGATFATDRPVCVMVGDGGFMLGGLAEFNAAVRHRCDLIVVVFNDGSYGAEYIQLRDRGLPLDLSLHDWPDLARLAEGLGGRGVSIRSMADFDAARAVIAGRDRPVLVEVHLDPATIPDKRNPDG